MVLGLGYLKDFYLYLTEREEESHQERIDMADVPSQEQLDSWSRDWRMHRKSFEEDFGRSITCHLPSALELAYESRETCYNFLQLSRALKERR